MARGQLAAGWEQGVIQRNCSRYCWDEQTARQPQIAARGAWAGWGSSARIHLSSCSQGNSQTSLRSWEPAAPARNYWDEW